MEIGGQCRLRPSAGLDKEVLSFQKEVLRVSLFSNYSKKLLKTGPPVLIICTFSMEPGARCAAKRGAVSCKQPSHEIFSFCSPPLPPVLVWHNRRHQSCRDMQRLLQVVWATSDIQSRPPCLSYQIRAVFLRQTSPDQNSTHQVSLVVATTFSLTKPLQYWSVRSCHSQWLPGG